jgi:hypothetical protein
MTSMTEKYFLVKFTSDETTRWQVHDKDLRVLLWHLNTSAGRSQTAGPEPLVEVSEVSPAGTLNGQKVFRLP